MTESTLPNLSHYLERYAHQLEVMRQNWLLDESAFGRFLTDRKLPSPGTLRTGRLELHQLGLIKSDGENWQGKPTFHPFRSYSFYNVMTEFSIEISISASATPDRIQNRVRNFVENRPTNDAIKEAARWSDSVIDLAILLEPIYWPEITGQIVGRFDQDDFDAYRKTVQEIVRSLDADTWNRAHEKLRLDAAALDQNDDLYLLLRFTEWDERKEVKGHIGAALWFRHIAEVIRRGFEQVYQIGWLEEDQRYNLWPRLRAYPNRPACLKAM